MHIRESFKACLSELKIGEADLKEFMEGGYKNADAKDNLKCHIKCVFEKEGQWKDGAFQAEAAIKKIREDEALKDHVANLEGAINECKTLKGTNDCETALKISLCIKDHKNFKKTP